jgi:histidinol phosphatase-like PHP family hydrolase
MTEDDIAYRLTDIQLREAIEASVKERNFWYGLATASHASKSLPYYEHQYDKYTRRVIELMAIQKEKFGE